jgi:hypothetical protein
MEGMLYVPVYDPYWIYARPRAGLSIGISFGPRIFIGASFGSFGWRAPGFDWRSHAVMIDNRPWQRTMVNRNTYTHSYQTPIVRRPAPAMTGAPRAYQEAHQTQPNRSDRAAKQAPVRREEKRDERRDDRHDDRR